MRRILTILGIVALALLAVPQMNATIYTLTSGNSTASIDASSQAGMYNWTIDGANIMYQQWFWYGVGTATQHSIDTLGVESAVATGDTLAVTYGSANGLEINIDYTLNGGSAGSHAADISETITILNHGSTSLDLRFYQYSDFDLTGVGSSDYVRIEPTTHQIVDQFPANGGLMLTETVATPRPTHAEANYYANTLNSLNGPTAYTLNDVLAAGPGDTTWAFEWDRTIASGGTFQISKDKNIAPVPEPAPLVFLGFVLVALSRKLRRSEA